MLAHEVFYQTTHKEKQSVCSTLADGSRKGKKEGSHRLSRWESLECVRMHFPRNQGLPMKKTYRNRN